MNNGYSSSNSQHSMVYLPHNHVVFVQIRKQVVRGTGRLVLDVVFQDPSQKLQEPYELEGV
jgi:hypothetical protein